MVIVLDLNVRASRRDEIVEQSTAVDANIVARRFLFLRLDTSSRLVSTVGFSGTSVGGPITTNTTWTLAGSPYTVSADVVVLVSISLTIEPGVTVKFGNGTSMIVDGTLIVQADSGDRTTFTSDLPSPALGDWGSIRTRTGGRIMGVGWTTVEYSAGGIEFPADSFHIVSDCVFRSNGVGISGSNVNITRCTLENNEDGVNAANVPVIDSEFCNNANAIVGSGVCAVQNTEVWNNGGNGIQITGTVTNCSIYDNGGYGGSAISIINCSIYGNNRYGATADTIINCSVHDNAEYGIIGSAVNCLVFNNSGGGISGDATNCLVFKNDGVGVAGACTNCAVHDNGEDGVSAGWNSVVNCQVYNNNGTGVSANKILGSDIFNNTGFGVDLEGYLPVVSNCDIHDNLAGGVAIQSVTVDRYTPPAGSQIENSKIHDNLFGILVSCAGGQWPNWYRDLLVSGCNISHNVENGIMTDAFVGSSSFHASIRLVVKDTIIDSNGRFGISLNATDTNGLVLYFPILEVAKCAITNHTVGLIGNLGNVADCIITNNSQTGLDLFQVVAEDQSVWYGTGWITITGIHRNNIYDNGIYSIKNHLPFGSRPKCNDELVGHYKRHRDRSSYI